MSICGNYGLDGKDIQRLHYGLSMAKNFDLAGYSDLEGKLGRPIPPGHVIIPGKIWLDEHDSLNWHLSPDVRFPIRTYTPTAKLLNDFVKLWEAPLRILPFAQKYGVLWRDANNVEASEHLGDWCRFSRHVYALLMIGAQLELRETLIDRNEWKYVGLFEERYLDRLTERSMARAQLGLEISRSWLNCGFSMRWKPRRSRFELEIDYRGAMVNALGLQLALTISNSDSLYICSGCGGPYARSRDKRRPKPGESNFCDNCGTAAALRQADKRRKAKMARARSLYSEGLSAKEIAKQLDAKVISVRRWVQRMQ